MKARALSMVLLYAAFITTIVTIPACIFEGQERPIGGSLRRINGSVTDSSSLRGIDGVLVEYSVQTETGYRSIASGNTDATGHYRLGLGVPVGFAPEGDVAYSKDGYRLRTVPLSDIFPLRDDIERTFDVSLVPQP